MATMWVSDFTDDKLYGYNLSTKLRDGSKDFNNLYNVNIDPNPANRSPNGIWSDGETMWVVDFFDNKIYGYVFSTRLWDSDRDFDTLSAAGNTAARGMWSDGETMWVADAGVDKIFGYNLSTKLRDDTKDFTTLIVADNENPIGLWSDGITMWCSDITDGSIYAYNVSTKLRDSDKDFTTLYVSDTDTGNIRPRGIWSDGGTMWVASSRDVKLYAFNLVSKLRDSDKDFTTLAAAGNTSLAGIWSDDPVGFSGEFSTGAVELSGNLIFSGVTDLSGELSTGAVAISGSISVAFPTYLSGELSSGTLAISGTVAVIVPVHISGELSSGTLVVSGTVAVIIPTRLSGVFSAGTISFTGSVIVIAPTYFSGEFSTLSGVALSGLVVVHSLVLVGNMSCATCSLDGLLVFDSNSTTVTRVPQNVVTFEDIIDRKYLPAYVGF